MLRERRAAHGCVRTRRSARRSPIVIAAAEAAVTAVVHIRRGPRGDATSSRVCGVSYSNMHSCVCVGGCAFGLGGGHACKAHPLTRPHPPKPPSQFS